MQSRPEVTEDTTLALGEELAPSGIIASPAVSREAVQLARFDDLGRIEPVGAYGTLGCLDAVHSSPPLDLRRAARAGGPDNAVAGG
jgi:hypothetical protein